MSTQATIPPPLPVLDTEAFRRKLAGLADPVARSPATAGEKANIREAANRLCSILAHLFGESLDRTTLWGRIGSAFQTSLAQVSDDDLERFVTLCLEHIRADDAQVAACDAMTSLMMEFYARPEEWRYSFLNHLRSHHFAVLTFGRARWEQVKAKEVEL